MQPTSEFNESGFSPSQREISLPPTIAHQVQIQRLSHRLTLWSRTISFWWYRILLIILSSSLVAILGQYTLNNSLKVFGGIIAILLLFLAVRNLGFGLLLTAIFAIVPLPHIVTVKTLVINPAMPLLLLLFFMLIKQIVFHIRLPVLPSLSFIWPLLGLIVTALLSELVIQITWNPGVPHQLNNNPLLYEEVLGIVILLIPLICLVVTTVSLTNKEQWIEYILYAFLILALSAAVVVMVDFKRIGVNVYNFRFVEPKIAWMSLRDLAFLMGLGLIIAYAHLLNAISWYTRIIYSGILLMCFIGTFLTLYNSEWIEVIIALVIMTFIYSFRLFICYCVAILPFISVLKPTFDRIFSVKSTEDFSRVFVWQDMLRVWSKHLWLGVGPGNLWTYDQYFTQLPPTLRNLGTSGLGVAHNGYLQVLGEQGLIGLFFWLALIVTIAITAIRLYYCSKTPDTRRDRMLALVGLGLISGSAVADFVSGGYILPARQVGGFNDLPPLLAHWIIFGCITFKYQLYRRTLNG